MKFTIPYINFYEFGRKLASEHNIKTSHKTINIKEIKRDAAILLRVFCLFDQAALQNQTIAPAAQWLIDNYYILDKSFQNIKTNLDKKKLLRLGRILNLCSSFLENNSYIFSKNNFAKFINAYQQENYITIDELWSIPLCLRIILLGKASAIASYLEERSLMRHKAQYILATLPKNKQLRFLSRYNKFLQSEHFLLNFYYNLREEERNTNSFAWLQTSGKTLPKLADRMENELAKTSVHMANIVKSIKQIDDLNWTKWLESCSQVDIYFSAHSEYAQLDTASRGVLRQKIAHIAKYSPHNELALAQQVVALCQQNGKLLASYLNVPIDENLAQIFAYKAPITKTILNYIYKYNLSFMLSLLFLPVFIFSYYLTLPWLLLSLPLSLEMGFSLFNKICSRILPPRFMLAYNFTDAIPSEHKSLVVVPCLLADYKIIDELVRNLAINYLASTKGDLFFALAADYTDSSSANDENNPKLLAYAKQKIAKLNEKYEHKFFLLNRHSLYNKSEETYMGWERKRGKLCELNRLLSGDTNTSFVQKPSELPANIKYIITLDSDTLLAPGSAGKLIGKMAYNLASDAKYSILQPRITNLMGSDTSLFQKIFARNSGFDPYIFGTAESYHDLFGEATYIGKAIYDIKSFMARTSGKIEENLVLSHDLLEGSYAKCAFVGDVELLEEYPTNYLSDVYRFSRWIRGDWQLLPYLGQKYGKLNNLTIVKMLDNLRRSLLPVSLVLCLLTAQNLKLQLLFIGAFFSSQIMGFFSALINFNSNIYFSSYIYDNLINFRNLCIDIIVKLSLLCHSAFYHLHAIWLALYRLSISHKYLLQWQTFQATQHSKKNFYKFLATMKYANIFSLCLLFYKPTIWAILWCNASILAYFLSYKTKLWPRGELTARQKANFLNFGRDIWRFYENFCNAENNFLPIDNFQEYKQPKIAHRTSPTNIGLYLLSVVAAHDFAWIDLNQASLYIENTLLTIRKMPKYKGHLYNWYDTKTLKALEPLSISSVDSGNLAGHLIALAGALKSWAAQNEDIKLKLNKLSQAATEFAYDMDFKFLLNKDRELLSIGFDMASQKLMQGEYDILASEARLAYFFAIAKGDIKREIWQKLGRFLTCMQGQAVLLSWSGSMFEYLMPILVLREHNKYLLGQTNKLIIQKQLKYGQANKRPWGISEAAFNRFDAELNYQYSNFGLPELGLKRNLAQDYVVAPYASFLAAQLEPKMALKNLETIYKLGAYGQYGFYDSIDYTKKRLQQNNYAIIKNYYAHHHGMSLLAIYNLLQNQQIQKYFYQDEAVQAFDFLLQEKAPNRVAFSNFKNILNINNEEPIFTATSQNIIENGDKTPPQLLLLGSDGFIVDNKAKVKNSHIQPIININNLEIGGNNTTAIFSPDKAIFQQEQNNISSSLCIIPVIHSIAGYGMELLISNHSHKAQSITINCDLLADGILEYENNNFSCHKAKFFIESLWQVQKNRLIYSNDILPQQNLSFYFWYFADDVNIAYLNFEQESQKSWLYEQTKLFHNNITSEQAIEYHKLLTLLLAHNAKPSLLFYINNKNYLYSLRDLLCALSFWQSKNFNCSLHIINEANTNYEELNHEINWLKQTYPNIAYQTENPEKALFSLHAQNGDVKEQLSFFKFKV